MDKKNILSIALLMTACAISQTMAAQESASAKGFYVGASAGAGVAVGKYSGASVGASSTATATNLSSNFGATGGIFGIITGYNYQKSALVLGLDASLGFDTTKKTFYDTTNMGSEAGGYQSVLSVKRSLNASLAPRIGYMFTNDSMIYAKFGIEYSKWQFKVTPNTAQINDALNVAATSSTNRSLSSQTTTNNKNSVSFAPGAGIELYRGKVLIRAEYSYLFGPNFKPSQNMAGIETAWFDGTSMQHNLKMSQHQFKVAVGYKF